MRYSRLSFTLLTCALVVPMSAVAFTPPSQDESKWHNYSWPRNEVTPQMYKPDYGTSQKYRDAMQDAESSLDKLVPPSQASAPQQGQPPATAYPPSYQQTPKGRAYPPTYSPQAMQGMPPQAPYYSGSVAPQAPSPYAGQVPYNPQAGYAPQQYNPQGLSQERATSRRQFDQSANDFWKLNFGAGLGYVPEFEGSDQNDLLILPIIDVSYKDTFFLNTGLGAGINVFNENGMRAGPFTTFDFGRDSDDASYLTGAEDVDPTLESGVFFEKEFDPFSFLWTARYAILNEGHGGVVSDAEVSYRMVIKPGFYGTVNGTVSWASQDYMVSYFGVSPNHSARSGLRGYTPDAGFKDFGIGGSLHYVVDDHISLLGNLGIKQLMGDAASSPIVEHGNELQYYGGSGVLYSF